MFTQKCFIKACNGFIIDKLKKIGYVTEDQIISTDSIIMTIPWSSRFISFDGSAEIEIRKSYRNIIDCGKNDELFLAIAALRDDSDIDNNQVFIHQDGNFYKCECDSKIDMWGDFEESESYPRKATVSELIELFNK